MITRSQTRRITSSPNPSETSLASFASEQDSENNLSSSNLSLIFDESPPLSYSEESSSNHYRTFSIENTSLISIIRMDTGLAFKLIPSFTGSSGGLLKFVEMCDTVALTTTPADNPLFLSIIYSKLEGKAFEFSREAVYADWPALKVALQKKFAPSKSVAQLQQDLTQLRQTGSVEEYGAALSRTLKNLKQAVEATAGAEAATVIEPMSQKLALTSFLANVKSDVGLILRARNPQTLEEATEIASEEEEVQKSRHSQNFVPKYPPPQSRPYNPNFQPQRPYHNQPNRPPYQPRPQANHNIPYQNTTYNNFRNQQPQPLLIKQEGVCTYCQVPGHDIYSCPEPNCRLSKLNQGPSGQPNFNKPPQNFNPPQNQQPYRPTNQNFGNDNRQQNQRPPYQQPSRQNGPNQGQRPPYNAMFLAEQPLPQYSTFSPYPQFPQFIPVQAYQPPPPKTKKPKQKNQAPPQPNPNQNLPPTNSGNSQGPTENRTHGAGL
jgi:hypothetical protein